MYARIWSCLGCCTRLSHQDNIFLHYINGFDVWISLGLWINPTCLSFPNNSSHWSRYCGTCYRRRACHVDVCRIYGGDGVFLRKSVSSPVPDHIVTNKRFSAYVWYAGGAFGWCSLDITRPSRAQFFSKMGGVIREKTENLVFQSNINASVYNTMPNYI